MLGITNFSASAHREVIERFIELARTGNVPPGNRPGHTDGWGIGWYRGAQALVVKSGGSLISGEKRFRRLIGRIGRSRLLIVHLRKSAWRGTSSGNHAHPFACRHFLFAHNGTVRDHRKLRKDIPPAFAPRENALDTEVFFRHILGFLPFGGSERALRESVSRIRKHNAYSSLNCLFADGKRLYAYREYTRNPRYYTLYHASKGGSDMVASEPLSKNVRWKMLPKGKLLAYGAARKRGE